MIVDCALYRDGVRDGDELPLERAFAACQGSDAFAWIGLHEPTEEEFEAVAREFELHELAVEDAINAHQRPKLELFGRSLFVVLKTARYVGPDEIDIGEILLFVGEDFIVSVRHGEAGALGGVRREVEERPDLLRCGPSAVLHAIIDRVVDEYQPVADALEADITGVETEVFSEDGATKAERLYKLKREVIEFRRAVSPLIDPLEWLATGRYELVDQTIQPYFRDVEDHVKRIVGRVEGYSELLTSVLEASLIQMTVRQNEDVRKISAWAAIFAVPTAIAGIYGMNFDHMPELKWTFGYPLVIAVIALVCVGLWLRFRRSGWL